jgi:hypothetical protein
MTDNLALWNRLGKTDPAHTKGFKRGGGFSGTAIKPVYTEQKMTETFGPCGLGWGFSEPRFELVPASEGQTAVYCWLSLWYVHEGKRSEPVPGVGGDFVVVKQSSGLRTNDEAFKAAFTDAIGNAMKHIGMSADVHMGLFDDSKYVRSLREEQEPAAPARQPAPTSQIHADSASAYVEMALIAIRASKSADDLNEWWTGELDARKKWRIAKDTDHYKTLWTACNERVFELEQKEAA